MYAGHVVESGNAADIFAHPSHPYTRGLLKAGPRLDDQRDRVLVPIEGAPLSPSNRPSGCPFMPRCKYKGKKCPLDHPPKLVPAPEECHFTACPLSREELDSLDNKEAIPVLNRNKETGSVILDVNDLNVSFDIRKGIFRRKVGQLDVLQHVSFQLRQGETMGLVGESGCGKTTVARSVLRLLPNAKGQILFGGTEMGSLSRENLRKERKRIQMIFQDPYSSLNPRKTIGDMIGEPLIIHGMTKSHAEYDRRVDELMELVGLDPKLKERVAHEFSGGQRQRVGIARALSSNPELIVCDEPISALDVSIQAQIINLMEKLQRELGLTYLFIAHDLSVVKHISDRISVMYLGNIVESAPCEELYANPQHPYTEALLAAIPIPDPQVELTRERLILKGEVPSIVKRPKGCCFRERCEHVMDVCHTSMPDVVDTGSEHLTACYLYHK
jgi:peptide/nickel transport system ATP-binding protein